MIPEGEALYDAARGELLVVSPEDGETVVYTAPVREALSALLGRPVADMTPDMLTLAEWAREVGVSAGRARQWIVAGRISAAFFDESFPPRGRWLVPRGTPKPTR